MKFFKIMILVFSILLGLSFNVYADNQAVDENEANKTQYQLVDVEQAWETGLTGKGVNVAVIDTGFGIKRSWEDTIDVHVDFPSIKEAHCFTDECEKLKQKGSFENYAVDEIDGEFKDHGVLSSSMIFAQHNGFGIKGIAPNANFFFLKATVEGGIDNSSIVRSLQWIKDWNDNHENNNKVHIVNMSWHLGSIFGFTDRKQDIQDLLQDLKKQGVILVAASGNEGSEKGSDSCGSIPATDDNVIAVSTIIPYAQDVNKRFQGTENGKYKYACPGPNVDITAHGSELTLASEPNKYSLGMGGTSFSAPMVAGLFALYKELYPHDSSEQLINRFYRNAHYYEGYNERDDPDTKLKRNDEFGYGIAKAPKFEDAIEKTSQLLNLKTDYGVKETPFKQKQLDLISPSTIRSMKGWNWLAEKDRYEWYEVQVGEYKGWIKPNDDEIVKGPENTISNGTIKLNGEYKLYNNNSSSIPQEIFKEISYNNDVVTIKEGYNWNIVGQFYSWYKIDDPIHDIYDKWVFVGENAQPIYQSGLFQNVFGKIKSTNHYLLNYREGSFEDLEMVSNEYVKYEFEEKVNINTMYLELSPYSLGKQLQVSFYDETGSVIEEIFSPSIEQINQGYFKLPKTYKNVKTIVVVNGDKEKLHINHLNFFGTYKKTGNIVPFKQTIQLKKGFVRFYEQPDERSKYKMNLNPDYEYITTEAMGWDIKNSRYTWFHTKDGWIKFSKDDEEPKGVYAYGHFDSGDYFTIKETARYADQFIDNKLNATSYFLYNDRLFTFGFSTLKDVKYVYVSLGFHIPENFLNLHLEFKVINELGEEEMISHKVTEEELSQEYFKLWDSSKKVKEVTVRGDGKGDEPYGAWLVLKEFELLDDKFEVK